VPAKPVEANLICKRAFCVPASNDTFVTKFGRVLCVGRVVLAAPVGEGCLAFGALGGGRLPTISSPGPHIKPKSS
jgi:hypothetical protein